MLEIRFNCVIIRGAEHDLSGQQLIIPLNGESNE
jgi:hypothetical protein